MACDQYSPSSWFTPNSSQPDFTSKYTLGSWVNIAWWGGAPDLANPQGWELLLGWSSDNNADSALLDGHSIEMTGNFGWTFKYGAGGNASWDVPDSDICGYTVLGIAWLIATDIDISSNHKFKIFALNKTSKGFSESGLPDGVTTKTSPGFLLLPSTVSSISSSVSAAANYSSSGASQTSSTPSNTLITVASTAAFSNSATPGSPPSGLSNGAKAGVGISCTLLACSMLLGAFFFMRRRRQQPANKIGPFSFGKPELDGRDAGERHELDEQHGISEVMEARITAPVEMPGNGYGSFRTVRGHQDDR